MKNSYHALLCCSVFSLLAGLNLRAQQPGTPDPTFGTTGIVVTDFGNFNEGYDIAVQPDGKILIGGYVNLVGNESFSVVRYNSNGTVDTAFGNAGMATVDFNGGTDHAKEVLLQADGRIVLAGYAFLGSSNADFAVARFMSNGDIDTSFGMQGQLTTDISGHDYAYAAALQTDGRIVVAGTTEAGVTGGDVGIVRYNTDGSLDLSFDADGIRFADIGGSYDLAFGMAIQTDGKIVTAGYSAVGNSYDFSVARFNTDGSFDTNFATAGKAVTPVGPVEDICTAMAIQSDGKIILAGYMWTVNYTDTDYGMVRYNSDGSLDNTFGTNGKIMGPISNSQDYLRGVVVQSNGKIVAAGQASTPGYTNLALIRFKANGELDSTFNNTGIVIHDVNGSNNQDALTDVALQPDGKILVTGMTVVSAVSDVDMVVARYMGDPELGSVDFIGWNNSVFICANPVTENSALTYSLTEAEKISIRLYDAQGKLVSVLVDNEMQQVGEHRQPLNLSPELSPGIYFVELSSPTGKVSVKIVK